MHLIKNPEFNRLLVRFVLCLFFFLALAATLNLFAVRQIHNTFTVSQAALAGVIAEKYPEVEEEIIQQILNPKKDAASLGEEVLSRYGIFADELLDTAALQSSYRLNLAVTLFSVTLVSSSFVLLCLLFLNKQYRQIRHITEYARKTKHGDYSLDIRDNREGDFSILKNEIYKITTLLREQAETLQRDKAVLTDSLADISHQLKTPMTSMLMLRDLLQETESEDMKEEFLLSMKSQLMRMEWLVTSLLKLTKLDAGTVVMKQDDVSVRKLVDKALEFVSIPLDIKMQQITVQGEDGVKFNGDLNWSCEALINILKNCVEHSPEGGTIQISFSGNPIYTVITISDNGTGIDPADLPYIFNRFYKGKNSYQDSVGIGLAMARAIVEKQGGIIDVQSEKGNGSLFSIKFYN